MVSISTIVPILVGVGVVIAMASIAPGIGKHCLNETYCCNECNNDTGSMCCFQYCDCSCDGKFDPFVDDPLYWFIERGVRR